MSIIQQLADSFISEATAAPTLMSDLATMEKYIAESYTGRSLIELLQNADDAESSLFLVRAIDDSTFIAANNGRAFTPDDMKSLCRSGASTKKRKSNTIGFRGIGFKSVVNYAETVHVLSGEYRFTFSRLQTIKLLPYIENVPLIRIPHEFTDKRYEDITEKIFEQGYATVFIFETASNKLKQEVSEFSSDCLLFLNHISRVVFMSNGKTQIIERTKTENDYGLLNCLSENNTQSEWLVVNSENKSALAFKWENDRIIPCNRDEAVVHSFLPTQEYLSIPMKINGDFSTEPSRTRISFDEETTTSLSSCATLVANLFNKVFHLYRDEIGLINIFSCLQTDPLSKLRGIRINDMIVEEFIKAIKGVVDAFLATSGKKGIAIQPNWLGDNDLELIRNNTDFVVISIDEEQAMPGIKLLFSRIGIKEIDVETVLKTCQENVLSSQTRVNIINTIANDTVFGMSGDRLPLLREAKLFETNDGVLSFQESAPDVGFTDEFIDKLLGSTDDSTKVNFVLRKVGFNDKQIAPVAPEVFSGQIDVKNTEKSFGKKTIKKWRSVEKNVAALLETLDNIDKVEDVSEQNLGYDIKTWSENGTESYYEVKSVNSLGDSISITNNEYSTANEYRQQYVLAIAQQNENSISVCFVRDPINNLDLVKRVVRWEWVANAYDGMVIEGNLEE